MPRYVIDGDESGAVLETSHPGALPWNGWAVPVATADEVRAWADALRRGDPNADIGQVVEIGATLELDRPDYPDVWRVASMDDAGVRRYALDGYVWTEID